MFGSFRKTKYIDFKSYKRMIDKIDDINFMDYVAKKQMKI